jgi:hypothetical protein
MQQFPFSGPCQNSLNFTSLSEQDIDFKFISRSESWLRPSGPAKYTWRPIVGLYKQKSTTLWDFGSTTSLDRAYEYVFVNWWASSMRLLMPLKQSNDVLLFKAYVGIVSELAPLIVILGGFNSLHTEQGHLQWLWEASDDTIRLAMMSTPPTEDSK